MQKLLELTQKLIAIPSESGKKEELEKILAAIAEELAEFPRESFSENDHPSLLIKNHKDAKKFRIILNAHLDVVPGKDTQYVPVEKDGKLFGRGAYDMKSGAAIMTQVFKDLAHKLPYDIALQIVTDEEVGGAEGVGLQLQKGLRADFVITGEPSDFRIVHKAKGIYRIKITAHGKTAHGAYPWNGDNAIAKINTFLHTLWKEFPIPKGAVWESTINVARIATENTAYNKIPDECSIFLDVRYIPEEKESILEKIKRLVPENFTFEVVLHGASAYIDTTHPDVARLAKIVEKHTQKLPNLSYAHGASDLHLFAEYNILGIEFGPMGAGLHSDEEWVEIESLSTYYNILKDFLFALS